MAVTAEKIDYDVDGLRKGVLKCLENIKVFEDAIAGEYTTITEYKRMIRVLEEKRNGSSSGHKH